ncbi:MAG: LysR family transcriptional regulator [Hyphomicrobiales bacterium]|nr:LysR family transcriptional regulator [Hyphomicrobiales bacterium]
MLIPRRYLPSISLLASFDAAARLQSFTLAAQEVNLTRSAVSRHIKGLEVQVGIALFMRYRQKVSLTPAGENYARVIHEALRMIASASMTLQINPSGGTLDLAILPTFGTIWLAPRLPGFLSGNAGVTVNFTTWLKPFDFNIERVDAAIHFGQPDWPNTEAVFLMNEMVLPVCSVEFFDRHQFTSSAQLCSAPLIHLSSRPDIWEHWFQHQGIKYQSNTGMVFDQFATAAQAAKHGLGIALLPVFLIERELKSGDLVPVSNNRIQSEEAYYLVWPEHRRNFPPLAAFKDWIVAEAKGWSG